MLGSPGILLKCWLLVAALLFVAIILFAFGGTPKNEVVDPPPSFQSHRQTETQFLTLLGVTPQTDRITLEESPTYKDLKNAILDDLKRVVNTTTKNNNDSSNFPTSIDYNSLKELIINEIRSIIDPNWEQIESKFDMLGISKNNNNNNLNQIQKLQKTFETQSDWIAKMKGYLSQLKNLQNSMVGAPEIRRITRLEKKIENLFKVARDQKELIERLTSDVQYSQTQLSYARQYFLEESLKSPGPTKAKTPTSKRKLIFSINAGHSGSGYLSQLLGTSANILSFNQREPRMSGIPLRLAKEYGLNATVSDRLTKAYAIENDLDKNQGKVYAEMSHLFISSFYDVVLEYFPKEHFDIRVIVLRRYFPDVLRTLVDNFFPTAQMYWYYTLQDQVALLPPLPGVTFDRVSMAIAYLFDIEAKIQWFKAKFPHIQIVEANIEDLQQIEGVRKLFMGLDVDITDQTRDFLTKSIVSQSNNKTDHWLDKPTIAKLLKEFYDQYDSAGKLDLLPNLPNLQETNTINDDLFNDDEEANLIRSKEDFLNFILQSSK